MKKRFNELTYKELFWKSPEEIQHLLEDKLKTEKPGNRARVLKRYALHVRNYANYHLRELRQGKLADKSEEADRHNQKITEQEQQVHKKLDSFNAILDELIHDLHRTQDIAFSTGGPERISSASAYDTLRWNGDPEVLLSVFHQLKELKSPFGDPLLQVSDEALVQFLTHHFQCSPAVTADRYRQYLERAKNELHPKRVRVELQ